MNLFNKVMVPAFAAALILGAVSISQAQTFTFTTNNNSTGAAQSTGSGPNAITGTGSGASNLFFTNTPDGTATDLNAPTNIVPFRIVPVFTTPAGSLSPPVGAVLTSNFNVTFNLALTLTSGVSNGTVNFTGLNFSGPLTATFLGVGQPNTTNGYSFSDNVTFMLPAADLIPQVVTLGGSRFSVSLVSFTNPGNPNGTTPEGNIGGRIRWLPFPNRARLR